MSASFPFKATKNLQRCGDVFSDSFDCKQGSFGSQYVLGHFKTNKSLKKRRTSPAQIITE